MAGRSSETSDLWGSLEELDKAEPISAEDDLILRMQAVSKVRSNKGGSKGRSKGGSKGSTKPSNGIEKKRTRRKSDGMKM